ncbi:MAG: hypothetical protein IIA92_04350 [Chloroflexi bacterium]|nr:hypothetical protein [Chloroflexota bacterium]
MDPTLDQMAKDLLKTNEDFALQLFAARLGIKVPDVTIDDVVQREIRRDPDLLRRLAKERVNRLRHGGKTEIELAEEAFGLAIRISEWKESGRWAGVVEKVFASGEVSKLVEAIIGIKSTDRQPASEKPLLPPTNNSADAATRVFPGGTRRGNEAASPPSVSPSDSNPQPIGTDTGGMQSPTTAASSLPPTPTFHQVSSRDPNVSSPPIENRPQKKRHKLTDRSPEDREKRQRIINQAILDLPNDPDGSEPTLTFGPKI